MLTVKLSTKNRKEIETKNRAFKWNHTTNPLHVQVSNGRTKIQQNDARPSVYLLPVITWIEIQLNVHQLNLKIFKRIFLFLFWNVSVDCVEKSKLCTVCIFPITFVSIIYTFVRHHWVILVFIRWQRWLKISPSKELSVLIWIVIYIIFFISVHHFHWVKFEWWRGRRQRCYNAQSTHRFHWYTTHTEQERKKSILFNQFL